MRRIFILFFLILALVAFAGPYEDHYESGGSGVNPNKYYEDIKNNDGNYEALNKNYENKPLNQLDLTDIDKYKGDLQQVTDGDRQSIKNSVNSVGGITKENQLKGTLGDLQSGNDLRTLGETYKCLKDEASYGSKSECQSKCDTVCEEYKFTFELSCQKSKEILRVRVPDFEKMTPAPRFEFIYDGYVFTTQPITAVCVNGFESGGNYFEYLVEGSKIGVSIPKNIADIGGCFSTLDKPFITSSAFYYKYIGNALQAHLSRLGYVVSQSNDSLDLTFNGIVAGACDGGSLKSGLPYAAEIESVKGGAVPPNVSNIAKSDPNYQMVTEGADFVTYNCEEKSTTVPMTTRQTVTKVFQVDVPNFPELMGSGGNYWGTNLYYTDKTSIRLDYCSDGGKYSFDFKSLLPLDDGEIIVDIKIEIIDYILAYQNATYKDCVDGRTIFGVGDGCELHNGRGKHGGKSILNLRLKVIAQVETNVDVFNVYQSSTCENIPKDCKLDNEHICDNKNSNCAQTIKKGLKTSEVPKKTCYNAATQIDNYVICTDGNLATAIGSKNSFNSPSGWFNTNREYTCDNSNKKDYSYLFKDASMAQSSATITDGGDFSFKTSGGSFNSNFKLGKPECIQSCKVKVPASYDNESVALPDSRTVAPSSDIDVTYYKPCVEKSSKWVCELEGQEVMVSGGTCGCADDFVDMVTNLQMLNAGKNMICSDK